MNLAVKMYQYCPNPLNIPNDWPCLVEELGESTQLPEGDGWVLMTCEEFSSYTSNRQNCYNSWYASQHPLDIYKIVDLQMQAAINFGNNLVREAAVENVLLGITQAGMTNTVRKVSTQVVAALNTGSLFDAIYEIRQIPEESKDEFFMCDSRLLRLINKIEEYLGAPLSTEV